MYGILLDREVDGCGCCRITLSHRGGKIEHTPRKNFQADVLGTRDSAKTSGGCVLVFDCTDICVGEDSHAMLSLYLVCLIVLGCVEGVSGILSNGFWFWYRRKSLKTGNR